MEESSAYIAKFHPESWYASTNNNRNSTPKGSMSLLLNQERRWKISPNHVCIELSVRTLATQCSRRSVRSTCRWPSSSPSTSTCTAWLGPESTVASSTDAVTTTGLERSVKRRPSNPMLTPQHSRPASSGRLCDPGSMPSPSEFPRAPWRLSRKVELRLSTTRTSDDLDSLRRRRQRGRSFSRRKILLSK